MRMHPNDVAELARKNITLPHGTLFVDVSEIGKNVVVKKHRQSGRLETYLEFFYVVPDNSLVERLEHVRVAGWECEMVDIVYTPHRGVLVKPGCMDLQPIAEVIERLTRFITSYAAEPNFDWADRRRLTDEFDCAAGVMYSQERAKWWLTVLKRAATYEWSAE